MSNGGSLRMARLVTATDGHESLVLLCRQDGLQLTHEACHACLMLLGCRCIGLLFALEGNTQVQRIDSGYLRTIAQAQITHHHLGHLARLVLGRASRTMRVITSVWRLCPADREGAENE